MDQSPNQRQRIGALHEELKSFLAHPCAVEIAMNQWTLDSGLPRPSLDLIQFIGFRMLKGEGIKEFAGNHDEKEVLELAFDTMRGESEDETIVAIEKVLDKLEAEKFLDAGKRVNPDSNPKHEWWGALESFLFPESDSSPEMQRGERAIARKVLESLFLRALFNLDVPRIQALVNTLSMIADDKLPELSNAQRIAGAVLLNRHALTVHLGRPPMKTEVQEFLLGVAPSLSDDPNVWAGAWKMVGWQSDEAATKRSDKEAIARLVAKVNRTRAAS